MGYLGEPQRPDSARSSKKCCNTLSALKKWPCPALLLHVQLATIGHRTQVLRKKLDSCAAGSHSLEFKVTTCSHLCDTYTVTCFKRAEVHISPETCVHFRSRLYAIDCNRTLLQMTAALPQLRGPLLAMRVILAVAPLIPQSVEQI